MAEVYPSDSELLNLLREEETGVEYIPTGTAPYYLHFRRLLQRLLLACRRGNDLRVYDEGGLDIGVKSGKYWVDMELVEFDGASGQTLADDKEAIYVYLDAAGNLVIDEYEGFPDMSESPHIRLAVVQTGQGRIVSLVDARDHHSIAMPSSGGAAGGGGLLVVEAHTGDDTLTVSESSSVHTNRGATGTVTLTLPAGASCGTEFTFAVQENQQLRVNPGASAIRDNCGWTAGKYKWAGAIGESLRLAADTDGNWITIAKNGVWYEEA